MCVRVKLGAHIDAGDTSDAGDTKLGRKLHLTILDVSAHVVTQGSKAQVQICHKQAYVYDCDDQFR